MKHLKEKQLPQQDRKIDKWGQIFIYSCSALPQKLIVIRYANTNITIIQVPPNNQSATALRLKCLLLISTLCIPAFMLHSIYLPSYLAADLPEFHRSIITTNYIALLKDRNSYFMSGILVFWKQTHFSDILFLTFIS